jgi:hypothetical protein
MRAVLIGLLGGAVEGAAWGFALWGALRLLAFVT